MGAWNCAVNVRAAKRNSALCLDGCLLPRKGIDLPPSLFDNAGDSQHCNSCSATLSQNSSTLIEGGTRCEHIVNYEYSFPGDSRILQHLKGAAHVTPALATCQACLDLGRPRTQQPVLRQRDPCDPAEVTCYFTGLIEPALPLASRMQRNRNQPVGLKALPVRFIGVSEPRCQRSRQAWMAPVLELVNNFFDRVLKGCPGASHIEAIQAPAAGPANGCFSGEGLRRKGVAANATKRVFNQVDAIPA